MVIFTNSKRMIENAEFEHGTTFPKTNITNDDIILTGKIAGALENYSRLVKVETEAGKYWKTSGHKSGPADRTSWSS